MIQFIDRKQEIEFLAKRFKLGQFEFFVIYGRRRVGKTELIKEFVKNKPAIYLVCDKKGTLNNIQRFKEKVSEFLHEPLIASDDLEYIMKYLVSKLKENAIIVFDEFSYLVEKDEAVPSIFQVAVDEALKNSNVMLILCGSSISMMERGVLSHSSPLYGRKTAHIKLDKIPFEYFFDFFPSNSLEKNIEFYAIIDGIPFYMEKFTDKKSAKENIFENIASKEGRLFEEVDFLLREELREPDTYKKILEAIANGNSKTVEIANASGINVQDIDKYLKVLINLGIIKKKMPVTEVKTKKTIYCFDDNFFNFYFSFIEKFKSDILIGRLDLLKQKIDENLNAFVGKNFEELIREQMFRKISIFNFTKVGTWWGHYRDENNIRKELEIDIVALNETTKEILFGECKWKNEVNAEKIVKELAEKAKYVEWNNRPTSEGRLSVRMESYAVFAKSFSKKIKVFEGKQVYCFDLSDLQKLIRK